MALGSHRGILKKPGGGPASPPKGEIKMSLDDEEEARYVFTFSVFLIL